MEDFINQEQRLFQDSLSRLLRESYDIALRRRLIGSDLGWSRDMWLRYAELGVLGATLPEQYGGSGGGGLELMLIMECFGQVAALEPFLASVVLGGSALTFAAEPDLRARLLPGVADGSVLLAWAHGERAARHDETFVATRAAKGGDGWTIDGEKFMALHAGAADFIVVTARVGGDLADQKGLGLFLVDAKAAGLKRAPVVLHDGSRAANLTFPGVAATPLGTPGEAWPAIRETLDRGMVATIAESVGAMDACLTATIDYLKTRRQFGVAIGSNQALQHRAAEMLVALEQARSMALLAALALDDADASERRRNLARAKLLAGRNGRFVAQQSIQLHGGIGVTEEAGVGHFFRRLMADEQMFGDSQSHLRRLSEELVGLNQ